MAVQRSTISNRARSGLDSGLDVLELLARERKELSLTEISAALGMSKSGVHSVLATLMRRGFIGRSLRGGYELGVKAWDVGSAVPGLDLAVFAAPHMAWLSEKIDEGVILGRLDGADVLYLHLVESPQAVRVHASVGDRIPAYCTSTGLALLASLTNEDVLSRLASRLKAVTSATLTTREEVMRELEVVRRRGYAINRGGWRLDVGGVSVCVRDEAGAALGALCVAVPRYRMTKVWVTRVVPLLEEAASRIGRLASRSRTATVPLTATIKRRA